MILHHCSFSFFHIFFFAFVITLYSGVKDERIVTIRICHFRGFLFFLRLPLLSVADLR